MANLLALWGSLSIIKRSLLLAATLGVFVAVLALARFGSGGSQSLLYAGLDPRTAGEVIAALDQTGTTYDVRGNAIYVPAADRDILRMQLAGQGLPAPGSSGYELLDNLSGFGTTSQMFDAAYTRAKEGELARTILAMPGVRAARVHLAAQPTTPFAEKRAATASVTVTTTAGTISAEQANALRHLIASAAGNMSPDSVAVIDSVSGLLSEAKADDLVSDAPNKAAEIKRNVERLLSARVGADRAVVEVSLDLVRETETITERKIDPETRVVISSDSEQGSESSQDGADAVSVSSNLPDGDAVAGGNGQSQSSTTRERVNFEVSETQRHISKEPGDIRRLTVAVLIDGERIKAEDGTETWQARSEEELSDLRDLVATAAGIDESRGDVLTLKSLEFMPLATMSTGAEAGFLPSFAPVDSLRVVQIVAVLIVILILVLFVVRPLLQQRQFSSPTEGVQDLQGKIALPPPNLSKSASALTGEIADGEMQGLPVVMIDRAVDDDGPSMTDPVSRLKRLIDQRQSESVEILRSWLEKQEERS